MEEKNLMINNTYKMNINDIIYVLLYFVIIELVLAIPMTVLVEVFDISLKTFVFAISNIKFVILIILAIVWYRNYLLSDIKKFKENWKKFLTIIIVAIILGTIVDTIINLLITIPESANQELVEDMFSHFPIVESISIVLFAPFIEEIIFRHILIGKLSSVIGINFAATLSCVLFAFIHSFFSITIISYLPVSICLTIVYLKTNKNVVASMVFHLLWNSIAFLMMIFL